MDVYNFHFIIQVQRRKAAQILKFLFWYPTTHSQDISLVQHKIEQSNNLSQNTGNSHYPCYEIADIMVTLSDFDNYNDKKQLVYEGHNTQQTYNVVASKDDSIQYLTI